MPPPTKVLGNYIYGNDFLNYLLITVYQFLRKILPQRHHNYSKHLSALYGPEVPFFINHSEI